MEDFEKLGAFYLGRRIDPTEGKETPELVLYDSSDLTTHAVIIGMTGSGKTGLGIGLIEEAALDRVPVIAIDPKGDLGNLLLTFPELAPADFEPWVDARAAAAAGQDVGEFAAATAETWKRGLAAWGQTRERIARLRAAAEFALFTPGSTAGLPIAVLSELEPPPAELREDAELVGERVASTVDSLMGLLGVEVDPITSPEHILLSRILHERWSRGEKAGIADLIAAIQDPGFEKLGVMDLETFYPAKERFALAMRLNGLLAAPGFDVWMQGQPLSAAGLLYTETGKPRVSVVSIAHLDDAERMFFVTLLLAEILTWMRMQPGSASLRAIVYMDEIFGYLPPVANPPSKRLFLTLLKQARAYGLGLVLSTQNPVDLDYKALSNAGTWFIGRLQTERDKKRVREGLESAAAAPGLSGGALDATLSSLAKRRFLLHNTHETAPVVFSTRWVMSYLAGPLTREQIRRLTPADTDAKVELTATTPGVPAAAAGPEPEPAATPVDAGAASALPPALAPSIRQCYLPIEDRAHDESIVYSPLLLAAVSLRYANARLGVELVREAVLALPFDADNVVAEWDDAVELGVVAGELQSEPAENVRYAPLPAGLGDTKRLASLERRLKTWLKSFRPVTIYKSSKLKLTSNADESEAAFRVRLQQAAREARDIEVGKLRKGYEQKVARIEERLHRAEQVLERESNEARNAQIDTALSVGTALLGALLGRKRISATSVNRAGSAMRKAGRARRQALDVKRAHETIERLRAELVDLEAQFAEEVDSIGDLYDAQQEELTVTEVRPRASEIAIRFFGIGWQHG